MRRRENLTLQKSVTMYGREEQEKVKNIKNPKKDTGPVKHTKTSASYFTPVSGNPLADAVDIYKTSVDNYDLWASMNNVKY